MSFLYLLEKIRVPVLDDFMLAITYLGDEIAFLVVALVLFWCVDKKMGYYILSVGFIGTIANQFMKLWFRVPRPWILDENFTILEQAREGAAGYSFPSGHTQSSVGTFGALAYTTKNKAVRWGCIAVAVFVPFSRMYLGVHTPTDVFCAAAMAIALIILLRPIVFGNTDRTMPILMTVMSLMAVAFLCFVELYPFPGDMDPHNMNSGLKNAYTLLGAIIGFFLVYYVDRQYIQFPTNAVWWAQLLKIGIGLVLVLTVKSGMKTPLEAVFGTLIGRAVRYFLIVIVAGILWPISFKWFAKLGKKECK